MSHHYWHRGYRESEQSWGELLRDLHSRGLTMEPKLGVSDEALGFWKAPWPRSMVIPASNAVGCTTRTISSTICQGGSAQGQEGFASDLDGGNTRGRLSSLR